MKAADLKLGDFILLKSKTKPNEDFYLLEIIRIADKNSYYTQGTPVYMVHINKNPYIGVIFNDNSQGSVTDAVLAYWNSLYTVEYISS